MSPSIDQLTRAVATAAALRRIRRLQPVGGPGDKIFPRASTSLG
jgi:hypothetical protein